VTYVFEILSELHRRGVNVEAVGENLTLRPRRALDGELLARIRMHKPEILAALKAVVSLGARPATCSPTCYEIEPGRWIHHPWDRCKTKPTSPPEEATPEVMRDCWHCGGSKACYCIVCVNPWTGEAGHCVPCKGTGKVWAWLQ
jgi:hypothetical protein